MKQEDIPLCVACDKTLTPADLFHENLLAVFRAQPWRVLSVLSWMLLGRAASRPSTSSDAGINWSALPLNAQVIALIRKAHATGRRVLLVAANDKSAALALFQHLNLFDQVIGADEPGKLDGPAKASMLTRLFGPQGYDYVGSNKLDLAVWTDARKAVLVTRSSRLIEQVRAVAEIEEVIPPVTPRARAYVRMLRIHQWLKNLLVFVPGMAAHRMGETAVFVSSAIAFLAFGLCASSVYILNDLADLENDRQHRTKHKRPLAAATVQIPHAIVLALVLLASSFAIAATMPLLFGEVLLGYFATTLLYSMWLKRQVIVDVMILAGLYTVRVIAGASVTEIQLSFWLLAFSIFLFLSLALVKRYAELNVSLREDKPRPVGRGYAVADLPVLLALGVASGFVAVLIMALYINNPDLQVAYPRPIWLWYVPGLLLYWISRMWMKTHRGEMHDDPVLFTARDWQSLSVVFFIAVCFLLAARVRG